MQSHERNTISDGKKIAGVVAGAALLGAGLVGNMIHGYSKEFNEARDAEVEALKTVEKGKVEDYTLIVRPGVNVREHPHMFMDRGSKSDANTAFEIKEETRIEHPLRVTVHSETDEDGRPLDFYLLPKRDGTAIQLENGELNPKAFDWIDARVVGERSSETGNAYAEIEYPDTSEQDLPKGTVKVTASDIVYQTADGQLIPVSVMKTTDK